MRKDANEKEEDSDDSADAEFESGLAEHMKMSCNLVEIQTRIIPEESRANLIKNDLSMTQERSEKTHRQVENVALFKQINAMQQEIKYIKSELAGTKAQNITLRENISKQRKEWDKCQLTINKLYCIIQQQKKDNDGLKLREEACESIGRDLLIAEEFVNTAESEMIEMEQTPDYQTEEIQCSENEENDMYENVFNNSSRRNHERLTQEDRHFIDSISWLKEEAEDLTIVCHDLQARLRCVIETLDNEQELKLEERLFDQTQLLRQYDWKREKWKL